MSDRVELSGAARWESNGVSVLMRRGSYRYLGHFLTPGQDPVSPCPPFRWAATGQKSVQSVRHSLALTKSVIPAEALAGPSPPRTPAGQEHGGPFSRDCESSFHLSTFLCRSLSARGNPVNRLDSLLTETVHSRGLAT